jgi:hypothetical protein
MEPSHAIGLQSVLRSALSAALVVEGTESERSRECTARELKVSTLMKRPGWFLPWACPCDL